MSTGTHPKTNPSAVLKRKISQDFEPGIDPYNTADTVRVSQRLTADFVAWTRAADKTDSEE